MSVPATVLMCAYNAAPYVTHALESILAQTWRDFEFLVIDDASTDDTPRILAGFGDPRLRLVRNERNLGLTASLNRGLREARGEWIARQDADDISAPERLERQLGCLRSNVETALIGSQAWAIDSAGRRQGWLDVPLAPESIRWASLFLNPVVHTAAVFRRTTFLDELHGYDERFRSCQDYELWERALARHPFRNLRERLVSYRMHPASVSATHGEAGPRLAREVLERLLARRGLRQEVSEAEVSLLARFRFGLDPHEVPAARKLIDRLYALGFPQPDSDARRTRAYLYAYLGYHLLTRSGAAGLRELMRATFLDAAYGATLPWLKILALAAMGERARALVAKLRGAPAAT